MKNIILLSFFMLLGLTASCNDVKTEYLTNILVTENNVLAFQSGASSQLIELNTDISLSELKVYVAGNGKKWCDATFNVENKTVIVNVKDNFSNRSRITIVTVVGKNLKQDIEISQKGNVIPTDSKIAISKVVATSFAEGNEPEKMIDGDLSTFFNSQFGAVSDWPFKIDFYFEDVERVDYLVYTPRPSGYNAWGSFGKIEVYAATEKNPVLTKVGEANFLQENDLSRELIFNKPLEYPTKIQVQVFDGFNDRVSCSEMQFFARNEDSKFDYKSIFTDASCSVLKDGITQAQIDVIPVLFYKQIAQNILAGNIDPYRLASFRPYQHPNVMAAVNKTSKYSLRDNATGIFVSDPEAEFILLVGDTHGQSISMNIYNYQTNKNTTFPLNEGLNVIVPKISGLVYIYNHTEKNVPLISKDEAFQKTIDELTVNIQFLSGEINGYFDISKHKVEDWKDILNNAVSAEIDVLGVYSHVTWTVADYKKYNTDIVLMTNYIDNIVDQQQEFAGLNCYNKRFANRAFIHIDYGAPAAYASDYRTAYNSGYANVMCEEAGFLRRMWVLGHEVGHVNQVRPGLKWHGTTEVTNNLYAIYNQYRILGEAPRLFDNTDKDGYGFGFREIIEAKQPHLLPDNFNNHIPKMAPFWQLYLYFVQIKGQEHFYHDIFEYFRTNNSPTEPGLQQLDFVRQVCRIGKMDMTDFFTEWGFLRPINSNINDYGNKMMIVTQKQIDELVAEIKAKGYPTPELKVEKITDRNYKGYLKK